MANEINIINSDEYGVIATIHGDDEADQLDDFLSENFYIHYDLRESSCKTDFLFGQGASIDIVRNILSGFKVK